MYLSLDQMISTIIYITLHSTIIAFSGDNIEMVAMEIFAVFLSLRFFLSFVVFLSSAFFSLICGFYLLCVFSSFRLLSPLCGFFLSSQRSFLSSLLPADAALPRMSKEVLAALWGPSCRASTADMSASSKDDFHAFFSSITLLWKVSSWFPRWRR